MQTLRFECVCLTVQVCPRTKGACGVVMRCCDTTRHSYCTRYEGVATKGMTRCTCCRTPRCENRR